MRRSLPHRWMLPCGAVLCLMAIAPMVLAQEPAGRDILLRNVYVPAEKSTAWPTGGAAYVPVEAERLAELLRTASPSATGDGAVAAERLMLYGSIDASGRIVGTGAMRLQIEGTGSQWLALPEGPSSITAAAWRDSDEAAELGYWGGGRQLALRVPRSGWLDFSWHTSPIGARSPLNEYRLALPSALNTVLYLDLPADQAPQASDGNLEATSADSGREGEPLAGRLPPVAPDKVRWLLTGGPQGTLGWQIPIRESDAAALTEASYTEEIEYRATRSGVRLRQTLDVQAADELPRRISLSLPASLVVRAANWDEVGVSLERKPQDPQAKLELTEAGRQPGQHRLEIEAWHPLASDQLTSLPQASLPDIYWLAGVMNLSLSATLQISSLEPRSLAQLRSKGSPATRMLHYEKLAPTGRLSLAVAQRAGTDTIRMGSEVELRSAGASATVDSQWLSPPSSAVRVLRATLGPGWQARLVTAELPHRVEEWYVEDSDAQSDLVVRVTQATGATVEGSPPLRLMVEASRPESTTENWLAAEDYHALQWQDCVAVADVATFSVEDGYQADWNPTPQALPSDEAASYVGELLPETSTGRVYDCSALTGNLLVRLRPAAPTVDAKVVTHVSDGLDYWEVSHRIDYRPRRGSLERLEIALPKPAPEVLRWKLEGEDAWHEEVVTSESDSAAGDARSLLKWQLLLPRRRSDAFAVLIDGGMTRKPTCLPALPQLAGVRSVQQAVQLDSPEARRLRVKASGWHLSTDEAADGGSADMTWIADPASGLQNMVIYRAAEESESLPLATLPWARLRSTYAPATPARHLLSLAVDNRAERELRCELPSDARDIRWQVGSTESKWLSAEDPQLTSVTIRLPAAGTQQARIAFTQPAPQLAEGTEVSVPRILLNVTRPEFVWEVRYPGSYEASPRHPATWQQRLFGPLAPTRYDIDQDDGRATSDGRFRTRELYVAAGGEPALDLTHRPTRGARQCFVLVLSALAGCMLWKRPAWLSVTLAASATLALLLPVWIYGWATAMWGGLLLAVVLRGLEAATVRLQEYWPTTGGRAIAGSATVASGVLLLALFASIARASEVEPVIESVFIPVDPNGRVVDANRYITPSLLSELLEREQLASRRDAWVVSAPRYAGSLSAGEQSGTRTASVGRWTVAFDLEVYRGPVEVELPFRRDDAAWGVAASLDGTATPLQWRDDGQRLSFAAPRSGRYRVKIDFQPIIRSKNDRWLFSMRVPPLPGGTMTIEAPGIAEQVTVNDQLLRAGEATSEGVPVQLGTESELVVEWPQQMAPTTRDAALASQWEWLDVEADRATIDGYYEVEGPLSDSPEVELLVDGVPAPMLASDADGQRRWRLVGPVAVEHVEDQLSVVRFRLSADRMARFGRLQLPSLRLAGTAIRLRRLAANVADELSISFEGASSDGEWLQEFESRWPGRPAPRSAVAVDSSGAKAVAAIRPATPNLSVDESLEVCCLEDRMELVYRGAIDSGARPLLSRTLEVSPSLSVRSVTLTVDNRDVPVDFSQQEDGDVLVLFSEPVVGSMELRVSGSTPLLTEELRDALVGVIPQITTSVDSAGTQQVILYAVDHLVVEPVQGEVEPQLVDAPAEAPGDWPAYWIGTYLTPPDRSTPLVVLVDENPAEFTADLLTVMIRRDNAWIAEIALLVEVDEGAVPDLVLDWPDALVGDVEVDANMGVDAELEYNGSRRLRLRMDRAVTQRQQLRLGLRSAVRVDEPQRMDCPVVRVHHARETSWYFGELQDDAGDWQWRGAKPAVAAARVEGLLAPWPSAKLWKGSVAERPTGTWTAKQSDARTYRLPLASVTVEEAVRGHTTLETQFVVPALEVDEFGVQLPGEQQLVGVEVDGTAALVVRDSDGQWRLQMPDPDLPHLVQLSTTISRGITKAPLDPPRLAVGERICTVDLRVWCVQSSAAMQVTASSTAEQATPSDVAALRLTQLLSASATSSGRLARQFSRGWSENWIAEIRAAESMLRQSLAAPRRDAADVVEPAGASQEYAALLTRTTAGLVRMRADAGLASASLDELPKGEEFGGVGHQVFTQSTDAPLRLIANSADAGDRLIRWALALGGLLLATLHLASGDRWRLPLEGYEFLFPIVILVGLAWWIALWPRLLGLLLALLAIVAWLRLNRIRSLAAGGD